MGKIRELYKARGNRPTREEIAQRAYELYQKDGEEFSPTEYWLKAEAELKNERAEGEAASRGSNDRQSNGEL
jgi:hypothetical protein